jgi:hypothetical protein
MTHNRGSILSLFFLVVPALTAAAGLTIERLSIHAERGFYLMDGEISYDLGEAALEALTNGVPLNFVIEIEVRQRRDYFWDGSITEVREHLRLEHHALTNRYLVINLNTDVQRSFRTLEDAIRALGKVERIPVIERAFLDLQARYYVRARARLRTSTLPPPLRLVAHFSPQWWLSTPWHVMELRP